jgi:hypothetical protein
VFDRRYWQNRFGGIPFIFELGIQSNVQIGKLLEQNCLINTFSRFFGKNPGDP